jgi:thiol-disulfide isomerase/thioredoxin
MQSHCIIYAVIAVIALYVCHRYLYLETPPTKQEKRPNIVAYYASWCGASRAFLPVWAEVCDRIANENLQIDVNSLNCDGKDNPNAVKVDVPNSVTVEPATCSAYGVTGYPTIILYNGRTSEVQFEGSRTADKIIEFIKTNC